MCDVQKVALKELNEPFILVPKSRDSHEKLKQLPFSEAAIQTLLVHKNIVRTLWADVCIVHPDTHEPLNVHFRDVMGVRFPPFIVQFDPMNAISV